MELGFVLVLVCIVLGFAGLMAKLSWDHEREKRQDKLRAQGQDNSLAVSELRAMIQEAVREATADLEVRIEALEQEREGHLREPAKLPLGRPAEEVERGKSDREEAAVPAQRSRA